MPQLAHRRHQRRTALLGGVEQRHAPHAGMVGREQEHRQHEQRQPKRRARADQALEDMTWVGTARELGRQHDEQRHQPTAIAQPPAEAAQPAHALGPHDVGQLRVVEHDRHLGPHGRGDDGPADRSGKIGPVGIGPPQRRAAGEQQQLEGEDVRFAPAAGIGHGAQERTQHGDEEKQK